MSAADPRDGTATPSFCATVRCPLGTHYHACYTGTLPPSHMATVRQRVSEGGHRGRPLDGSTTRKAHTTPLNTHPP